MAVPQKEMSEFLKACRDCDEDKVLAIMNSGQEIDLSECSENGNTALHYLVTHAMGTLLNQLVAKIPDYLKKFINTQNAQGDTALHLAVKMRTDNDLIQKLCLLGADVNIRNKENQTPYHLLLQYHQGEAQLIDEPMELALNPKSVVNVAKIQKGSDRLYTIQLLLHKKITDLEKTNASHSSYTPDFWNQTPLTKELLAEMAEAQRLEQSLKELKWISNGLARADSLLNYFLEALFTCKTPEARLVLADCIEICYRPDIPQNTPKT